MAPDGQPVMENKDGKAIAEEGQPKANRIQEDGS
jgi:hypothetical protein